VAWHSSRSAGVVDKGAITGQSLFRFEAGMQVQDPMTLHELRFVSVSDNQTVPAIITCGGIARRHCDLRTFPTRDMTIP